MLALVSALTLLSGAWSIRKTKNDNQKALRQEQLLAEQIQRASDLRQRVEEGQAEYDTLSEALPQEREDYEKASADYKKDLNEYTLSRIGLVLGRKAMGQAWSAMQQGLKQFEEGRAAFEEGRTAFDSIFAIYLEARNGLDRGWSAYQEGVNRLMLEEEAPQDILQAEDALLLVDSARQGTAALGELVTALRQETPEGQAQAAQALVNAMQELQRIGTMNIGDIQSLSYSAGERIYQQAKAQAEAQIQAGTPEAEAYAQADALVRQSLDIGYEELGLWLQENEDTVTGAIASLPQLDLSEAQMEMLTEFLPDDQTLLDDALILLEQTDQDLAQREQEIRDNPEALNAPDLLISLLNLQLSAADHLMGLFEPQILAAKQQLDAVAAQMVEAEKLLAEGQRALQNGWNQLYATEKGLPETAAELRERKAALEEDYRSLTGREETAEAFENLLSSFRSARASLMSDEEIAGRVHGGEDLIEAAQAVSLERAAHHAEELTARIRMCVLMLCGAAFGVLAALGGFEKPRIRPLWLPLIPAILLTMAGELQSMALGPGLWYTAIFVTIFGLAMLPLSFEKK